MGALWRHLENIIERSMSSSDAALCQSATTAASVRLSVCLSVLCLSHKTVHFVEPCLFGYCSILTGNPMLEVEAIG